MAKVSEDNLDLLKNKFQETIMTYYPTFFFGRTRVYINTYDVSTDSKVVCRLLQKCGNQIAKTPSASECNRNTVLYLFFAGNIFYAYVRCLNNNTWNPAMFLHTRVVGVRARNIYTHYIYICVTGKTSSQDLRTQRH